MPTNGTRALQLLVSGADERNYPPPYISDYNQEFMIARWELSDQRILFINWTSEKQYHYRLRSASGIDLDAETNLPLDTILDRLGQELK
jgi:hypothetical protein